MSDEFVVIYWLNGIISDNFMKVWRVKSCNSFISIYFIKGVHKFLAIEVFEVSDE